MQDENNRTYAENSLKSNSDFKSETSSLKLPTPISKCFEKMG